MVMAAADMRETYESAIQHLNQYVKKLPDGTLEIAIDNEKLGMDPVIFADLKRSLEETNRKIKSGELSVDQIAPPEFHEVNR
jgi:hypothetical protein